MRTYGSRPSRGGAISTGSRYFHEANAPQRNQRYPNASSSAFRSAPTWSTGPSWRGMNSTRPHYSRSNSAGYTHPSGMRCTQSSSAVLNDTEDRLPVKPGPNAIKPSNNTSPVQRMRRVASSSRPEGSSLNERKAFDAKRFKIQSEPIGGIHRVLFSDTDKEDESEAEVSSIIPKSIPKDAVDKTRLHLASVDSELLLVDAEISRLKAKREELVKQRSNLNDILSSMTEPSVSAVKSQTQSSNIPTSLSKQSKKLSNTQIELQCPEISTHSLVSPAFVPAPGLPSVKVTSTKRQTKVVPHSTPESNVDTPKTSQASAEPMVGTMHLMFRDIDSGYSSRGADDDSLIMTSICSVANDPDVLLLGNKSGHICKYSIMHQKVIRKELIFRKSVTALCGVISPETGHELRIFVGSSDGEYRCYNGNLSEVIASKSFGWGVSCIKHLLSHVYIGIGNGLINIVCPKRGVVLERFSAGRSFIYDIEALQESARDTIVCSLKSSDHLSVRDAADGLALRNIEVPLLPSFIGDANTLFCAPSLKEVNSAASPLACTNLACAGGFVFACQANGQLLAVAPGYRKATCIANLDSRPVKLSILGENTEKGIYVSVITADAIIRVYRISSSAPMGRKKKRAVTTRRHSLRNRISSSSEDEEDESGSLLTFDHIFQASMASEDWSVRSAAITSSDLLSELQGRQKCQLHYPTMGT